MSRTFFVCLWFIVWVFVVCLFLFVCLLLFLFVNWYTMFDGVTRDLFLEQVCVKGLPVVCTDEPCI